MNKEINKLIPEIRFPEFIEPWKTIAVSDVCDVFRGGTFSKADMDENGTELCIHYGELFTKYNEVISAIYSKTNKEDSFKSKIGDILMPSSDVTPDGLAKASAITIDNVVLGGDMNILRPKTTINSIFLSYLLNYSKSEIIKLVSGTTVKHIYPSQIITCQLPIVNCVPEQQKIASCLSSLDELIAVHSQKLDSLKDHKKGLMQNLFPQEGETVPKWRFPDFVNDGVWVEKIFDDILYITRLAGYEYSEYWEEDPNKEIIALRGYNIGKGKLLLNNLGFISNELSLKLIRSRLFKGDIVYPCVGTIGNAVVIEEDNKFHIQQNIAKLTPKADVSPYFISQFLMSELGMREVNKFNATSSQPNVLVGSLRNFKIFFPKIKEQKKIASFLSSLDALIAAQTEKIDQLKLHKKGLMQGLFPIIND